MDRFLNTIEGVELLVTTKKECLSLVWKYGLTEEERENIALEDLTFENLHTIATNYSVYRESIISGFKRIKEVFIEDTKIFLEKFDRKIEVIDALQQRIVNTRRFSSSNFLGVTNYESVPYKVIIDQCEHLTHDLKDLKAETLDSKEYIWKDIFKDEITFKSFEKYIKVCIVEPYADLSYLFQRLTNEKLFLGTIPHMDFAEWMRSNEFISPRDFEKISEERGFRSYTKSKTSERIQKFNTTFGL